jgi:peptide/nickel transport system permease protein
MELLTILLRSQRFMIGITLFLLVLLFAILGPMLTAREPLERVGGLYNPPSSEALLGTDNFGRDVLTQLMYGTRTSLFIGVIAGLVATFVGVFIGTLAGYLGGLVEEGLMGITNVLITIPPIVVLILLSVAINARSAAIMGIIIGVTAWPWTARAVRAQTSSLRTREHINIARISGVGHLEMMLVEVLPYMFSYIFMAFILQFTGGILAEATLSMLGLGPFQTISLGVMLNWALLWEAVRVGAWWAFVPPTVFLSITSFALMLMNAGMDEIFNPTLRHTQ